MSKQIPLPLSWHSARTLDDFIYPDRTQHAMLLAALSANTSRSILLVGPSGSGKSALVQCMQADARFADLDLRSASALTQSRQQSQARIWVVEDVQAAAQQADLELALFTDYNRAFDQGKIWFATSDATPEQLAIGLPDLRSRLSQCLQLRLPKVESDAERVELLQIQAQSAGMHLDSSLISYLQTHVSRDLAVLSNWLRRLDQESLSRKRKPTVALLRELLQQDQAL